MFIWICEHYHQQHKTYRSHIIRRTIPNIDKKTDILVPMKNLALKIIQMHYMKLCHQQQTLARRTQKSCFRIKIQDYLTGFIDITNKTPDAQFHHNLAGLLQISLTLTAHMRDLLHVHNHNSTARVSSGILCLGRQHNSVGKQKFWNCLYLYGLM